MPSLRPKTVAGRPRQGAGRRMPPRSAGPPLRALAEKNFQSCCQATTRAVDPPSVRLERAQPARHSAARSRHPTGESRNSCPASTRRTGTALPRAPSCRTGSLAQMCLTWPCFWLNSRPRERMRLSLGLYADRGWPRKRGRRRSRPKRWSAGGTSSPSCGAKRTRRGLRPGGAVPGREQRPGRAAKAHPAHPGVGRAARGRGGPGRRGRRKFRPLTHDKALGERRSAQPLRDRL